jgi:CDGSH-type Zn-finger protein
MTEEAPQKRKPYCRPDGTTYHAFKSKEEQEALKQERIKEKMHGQSGS